MTRKNFEIDDLRVAAPCPMSWDAMTGDERVRRCHACDLNIYNIAEMTADEARRLIENREGRLCIRLHRRADGTVTTKDCPRGLSAYRQRVARLAGAALTALLGLVSVSFGQKEEKTELEPSRVKITRTLNTGQTSVLFGSVLDPNGAVVPDVEIKLYRVEGKKKSLKTSAVSGRDGEYAFSSLAAGRYVLEIKIEYFKKYRVVIDVNEREKNQLDPVLEVEGKTVTVGIYAGEALIDLTSTSVKTTINREQMGMPPR